MRSATAGAVAGLVAGAILSGVLAIGRDAGVLQKTLSEEAEDWLDTRFDTRRRVGESGTQLIEQTGHYLASVGLGATYGKLRDYFGFVPGAISGALFGAGLYAFGVAGVLPELGVTRGEPNEAPGVPTERFGLHLLYGAVLGIVTDGLRDR
jgi:hypothetical protein